MHLLQVALAWLVAHHAIPLGLAALALVFRGRLAQVVTLGAIAWALAPVLTVQSVPLEGQPWPDSFEYADAAQQMAHGNGYVTYVHGDGPVPPRYPPGFSLSLAPFAAFGGFPDNVQLGVRAFALLYVVLAVAVAWRLGGWSAASFAAILIGSSPFASVSGSLVLSDAFAAGLSLPLVLLVRSASPKLAAVAGVLTGVLTTIRLSSGLALPALLVGARGRSRWTILAGAAPLVLGLGIFQWLNFGSPLRTGYDYWLPGAKYFDLALLTSTRDFVDGPWLVPDRLGGRLMEWVCPCADGGPQATAANIVLYPAVLLGLFWTFAPPLVGVVGLFYLWRRRQDPDARFTFALTLLTVGFYCVYFYQGTRFVAAPATLLAIYGAVGIESGTRHAEQLLRRLVRRQDAADAKRPIDPPPQDGLQSEQDPERRPAERSPSGTYVTLDDRPLS